MYGFPRLRKQILIRRHRQLKKDGSGRADKSKDIKSKSKEKKSKKTKKHSEHKKAKKSKSHEELHHRIPPKGTKLEFKKTAVEDADDDTPQNNNGIVKPNDDLVNSTEDANGLQVPIDDLTAYDDEESNSDNIVIVGTEAPITAAPTSPPLVIPPTLPPTCLECDDVSESEVLEAETARTFHHSKNRQRERGRRKLRR